jgi:hypothetical protein
MSQVVKVLGLGLRPYIFNHWNKFDALITILSLVSLIGNVGGLSSVFRVLRLARVLKLLPKARRLMSVVMVGYSMIGHNCMA